MDVMIEYVGIIHGQGAVPSFEREGITIARESYIMNTSNGHYYPYTNPDLRLLCKRSGSSSGQILSQHQKIYG